MEPASCVAQTCGCNAAQNNSECARSQHKSHSVRPCFICPCNTDRIHFLLHYVWGQCASEHKHLFLWLLCNCMQQRYVTRTVRIRGKQTSTIQNVNIIRKHSSNTTDWLNISTAFWLPYRFPAYHRSWADVAYYHFSLQSHSVCLYLKSRSHHHRGFFSQAKTIKSSPSQVMV